MSYLVTVPTFVDFHKTTSECLHWNFSILDKITIASALDDNIVVYNMMMLTFLYSAIAYAFLGSFCYDMSQTEFTSTE